MPDREAVIQRLTELNEEFRRLRAEHQAHEDELDPAPDTAVPDERAAVARQ